MENKCCRECKENMSFLYGCKNICSVFIVPLRCQGTHDILNFDSNGEIPKGKLDRYKPAKKEKNLSIAK